LIPRLVVASKNGDKIAEIESILGGLGVVDEIVRGLDWPDIEETGDTLEDNALLKARTVATTVGLPSLGDDTGLEVAALDGRPGVWTARYAGPSASYGDNVTKLLDEMRDAADRSARFRTVVALVMPDGWEMVAEGSIEGEIAMASRGSDGFGYDPVFEIDGQTLAEMGSEQKNRLSHRSMALHALASSLGLENR
jgi:XTP/dITP diphosphohydrolase